MRVEYTVVAHVEPKWKGATLTVDWNDRRIYTVDGSFYGKVPSGYGEGTINIKTMGGNSLMMKVVEPAIPPAVVGRKDDSGKLDMTLLDDMPRAIAAVVEVMQWAITKKKPVPYVRGSWLGVSADRYRAAIKRHDNDACLQYHAVPVGTVRPEIRFQKDKETDLLHAAHIACSSLMSLELILREIETKDKASESARTAG